MTKNSTSATLCHLTEAYGHLSMTDNQFMVGEKVCIIPANLEATISAHDTFAFVQDDRVLRYCQFCSRRALLLKETKDVEDNPDVKDNPM